MSIILITIGISIVLGMLYTMVALAKQAGVSEEVALQDKAEAELVKRQTEEELKPRTVDDVADDLDKGEF